MRPTTMILGSDNRKKWSTLDVLIMQAYEIYKGEQCQSCGYPIWICRNKDITLIAKKKVVSCWISQEVDRWREQMKDDDDAKYLRADVVSRTEKPLTDYRLPYYESLAEEADDSD